MIRFRVVTDQMPFAEHVGLCGMEVCDAQFCFLERCVMSSEYSSSFVLWENAVREISVHAL